MATRTSQTWTSFHRRGDVLRAVVAATDVRRDGVLPMDVAGVRETFDDELDLLGALSLRWHTRLAGRIERELMLRPDDAEAAVLSAWRDTAAELPGIRAVLDEHRDAPRDPATDPATAEAVLKATAKEHVLLATMAGRCAPQDAAAPAVGAELEEAARAGHVSPARELRQRSHAADHPGLLERLRAALVA